MTIRWLETYQQYLLKLHLHSTQCSNAKSHIDRIYVPETIFKYCTNWDFTSNGGLSNHTIPFIDIVKQGLLHIGPGLWRLPVSLLTPWGSH